MAIAIHRLVFAAVLFVTATSTTGCLQKCQQPELQSFRSVVDAQWRLVESTDPAVAGELDRFNFLIVTFGRNNSGTVHKVVDNDQYNDPVMTLQWVPEPSSKLLRIKYTLTEDGSDQGTFDYKYTLNGELNLREVGTGYLFRYIPFKGVVDPDSNCTF